MPPGALRLREAIFFREKFDESCSPATQDSYFLWIAYSDAFLMSIVSLEELIGPRKQGRLRASDLFRFLKAIRNITVHHTVISAPKHKHGGRATHVQDLGININEGISASTSVLPRIHIADLRRLLSRRLKQKNFPSREKGNIVAARRYLSQRTRTGPEIYLKELFEEAIRLVSEICEYK
jgi:hypothetical protein